MKKILFPTDFSGSASNALEYAIQLAEVLDAEVDLMHVYHIPSGMASRVYPDEIDELLAAQKEEAILALESFMEPFSDQFIGKVRVDYGIFVYQEIIDAAAQLPYDLIVMGTKGKHKAMEKFMGSVTTLTMMHAPCPVLAIPEGATFKDIQSIVYATDFHPTDSHAVSSLMAFAGKLAADVHFVHVDTKVRPDSIDNYIIIEDHPFKFTDFFVIGGPSVLEGLDQFVQQKEVDMMALFIPRRRLWERLFHTSFSKKMAFHTKLPLMVFHE